MTEPTTEAGGRPFLSLDLPEAEVVFYPAFFPKAEADRLLKQLVETWLARCSSLFAPPADYPDVSEDPDALLDFCIERDVQIYEFLWQTRATMRILRSCQGEYAYLIDAFKTETQRRSREWIEQWRRDGLFRDEIDTTLAATLISITGTYMVRDTGLLKLANCTGRSFLMSSESGRGTEDSSNGFSVSLSEGVRR